MNERAKNGLKSWGGWAAAAVAAAALAASYTRACIAESKIDVRYAEENRSRIENIEYWRQEHQQETMRRIEQIDRIDKEQARRTSKIEEFGERLTAIEARVGNVERGVNEILLRLPAKPTGGQR